MRESWRNGTWIIIGLAALSAYAALVLYILHTQG
jgi:hypothetical protein